jgi:hypothetical protein
MQNINPLKTQLNPICHLLALLGVHPILHFSRLRVKQLCLSAVILFVFNFRVCYVTLFSVYKQYNVGDDDCGARLEQWNSDDTG